MSYLNQPAKRIFRTLVVLGMLLCNGMVSGQPELTLVDRGRATATIVLPEKTELQDDEKLAAAELQEFIEKISGARLEIKRSSSAALPSGPSLVLGRELATALGYGDALGKLDKDGILIATGENRIIIAGKRARGTLYAAYAFLESLGVRWVMPGEFGEIYPERETITASINLTENPSHEQRYWVPKWGHGEAFPRWTLRNRGNFVRAPGDQRINQEHALQQPLRWGAENPQYGIKVKQYVADPETMVSRLPDEYYAMFRNRLMYDTPNMSNPKVWDLYAQYYIDWFTKHPEQDYVSISPANGVLRDTRPASYDVSSMEPDGLKGEYSATDMLWFFYSRVLEKVTGVFPDKKFGVLLIYYNTLAPKLERVHSNMALVYSPISACPLHDLHNDTCKTNRIYLETLKSWALQAEATGAESYLRDYLPLGFQWNVAMICPQWPIIGKNYPYYHHHLGIKGHTSQGIDDWGASHFNHWLAMRLYWNVDQDYKEILEDYCLIRYGKAAPAVMKYYTILEKRMDEIPDLCSNEIWGNHLVLTPGVRAACRAALEAAEKLVEGPREKAHLETLVDMQVSTDAWCDGIEIAREEGDYAKAMQVMEKSFEVQQKLNRLYSHFVNPHLLNRESLQRHTTGGWFNKYNSFDQKIRSASSSVVLPRYMKVALDTENRAWSRGLHEPEVSVEGLEDWDVTMVPDIKFGTQREISAFFYRCAVEVPEEFNSGNATLYFPSVIARAMQVWINGEPVKIPHDGYEDSIYRGYPAFWYDYNHELEFDVSHMLEPGQTNTIAFRIFKNMDHAGTYDRVFLLAR